MYILISLLNNIKIDMFRRSATIFILEKKEKKRGATISNIVKENK